MAERVLVTPEPYYSDELVTLYHGDCREILPALGSVDAAITDPPYGVGVDYGDDFADTPEYVESLVLDVLPQLRSKARIVAVTPGTVNLWRYPPTPSVLCWVHTTNLATSRKNPIARLMPQRSWQPVLVYGDRYAVLRTDLYAAPTIRSSADHPCPKPDHFARWLVLRISDEGETVLDPFAGSGAFIDAARYTGRKSIGIEISERYCERIATRLAQDILDFAESS